jgi:hypothetical protein
VVDSELVWTTEGVVAALVLLPPVDGCVVDDIASPESGGFPGDVVVASPLGTMNVLASDVGRLMLASTPPGVPAS